MDRTRKLLLNIANIALIPVVGALQVIGVDAGLTDRFKFLRGVVFFGSISSLAISSSSYSCSASFALCA